MAALQNPSVEVEDNGNGYFTIKQITLIKTHTVKFRLNEEMDETTPDGRKVKVGQLLTDKDKLHIKSVVHM